MYSSTLYLTSVPDGSEWSTPRPGRFTPEKETSYPWSRWLCGSLGRCGRVRKISSQPGFDLRTVQSVKSRSTDYATATREALYVGPN
jgi:hypothetical protein